MLDMFEDLQIDPAAATFIAQGLRALARVDGLSNSELALVEQFERDHGIERTDGRDFDVAGQDCLGSAQLKEAFLSSLLLMSLADGRVSAREEEMIDSVAGSLGIPSDRRIALDRSARKYLLRYFAGVQAFRDQAVSIGKSLGLSAEEIGEVLD